MSILCNFVENFLFCSSHSLCFGLALLFSGLWKFICSSIITLLRALICGWDFQHLQWWLCLVACKLEFAKNGGLSSEVSVMQFFFGFFLPGKLSSKSLAKGIIWVQKQKLVKQRNPSNASDTRKKKECRGDFLSPYLTLTLHLLRHPRHECILSAWGDAGKCLEDDVL